MAEIGVERTDFVNNATQDLERAERFHGETLGLPRNPRSSDSWPEYRNALILHCRYAPYADGTTP